MLMSYDKGFVVVVVASMTKQVEPIDAPMMRSHMLVVEGETRKKRGRSKLTWIEMLKRRYVIDQHDGRDGPKFSFIEI